MRSVGDVAVLPQDGRVGEGGGNEGYKHSPPDCCNCEALSVQDSLDAKVWLAEAERSIPTRPIFTGLSVLNVSTSFAGNFGAFGATTSRDCRAAVGDSDGHQQWR